MPHIDPAKTAPLEHRQAPLPVLFAADLRSFWPLWLLVLGAVAIRFYRLGDLPGLIGDEAWYGVQAQRLTSGTGSDLRTPTGNVPGLFQLGTTILLHQIGEPSALLLRLPAVLSSITALALAYAIGRRFFGSVAGMAALIIMACLPAAMAYARLGWDPSHAAMFILAAVYATLDRRRLLAGLLFAMALANHPAAVFVAPFLVFAYGGATFRHARRRTTLVHTGGFVLLLALAISLSTLLSPSATSYLAPAQSLARLIDPAQWVSFGGGYVRLLSGDTTSIFLAGRGLGTAGPLAHTVIAFILAALAITGAVSLVSRPNPLEAAICLGWCTSALLLFIVAGPWALRAGLERFAMPLLPLTAVVIAVLVQRLTTRVVAQGVLAATGLAGLASVGLTLFQPLASGESRRAGAVWIGFPSLNGKALDAIDQVAPPGKVSVVAEDWWIYWPLAYAAPASRFRILDSTSGVGRAGQAYWISYRGSEMDRSLADLDYSLTGTVTSADGVEALRIWRSPAYLFTTADAR